MTPTAPVGAAPRKGPVRRIVSLLLVLVGLLVAGLGVFSAAKGDPESGSSEVFLEPAAAPGANPVVPSGTAPEVPAAAAGLPPPPIPAGTDEGVRTVAGTAPGLYGGTKDASLCNTEQIITYLEQHPGRASVWARVLGVAPSEIRSYVTRLTPVVLRADTRVTMYRLAADRAVSSQAVMQSGTAVLVAPSGLPRVRCGSGNPLGEARAVGTRDGGPRYAGTPWPAFTPTGPIVIAPTAPIGGIIIVDLTRGLVIVRQPGAVDVVIPRLPPLLLPGDPVVVVGRQFPPGTSVRIRYDVPNRTLDTVTADGAGTVDATVSVPLESSSGPHRVTAAGGGVSNELLIYVLPAGS